MKYVKIALSLALLGLLIGSADWSAIGAELGRAHVGILAVVFLILAVQFPISAYKWGTSLLIHGLSYPFLFLQKVLCAAFFFNNFLPTSVGGDGYRVFKTLPREGLRSRAVSAVLLERATGFAALLFLGFLFALVSYRFHDTPLVTTFVTLGGIGCAGALVGLLLYVRGTVNALLEKALRGKKLGFLFENVRLILSSRRRLAEIIAVSFFFQALAITSVFLLYRAFGVNAGFSICALITALSGVVAVLPISINGIGLTEGTFVYVATQLGLDFDQSIVVAFTLRALNVPLSLLCGLLYFFDSSLARQPSASTEADAAPNVGDSAKAPRPPGHGR